MKRENDPQHKTENIGRVETGIGNKVIKRYKDAYLIARTVDGFGTVIKVIGGILALIIIFPSFFTFLQGYQGIIGFIGIGVGIIVGVLFFLLGVIVSAQGQILMASLDGAVNSSPFLTNVQKGKAMSL